MYKMSFRNWLFFTFINLLIVAFLGLILRYKITFSIPFIDQKYLQHGHSHFALTGWISQALMVLLSNQVSKQISLDHFKKYQWILILNMVAAYGMLFSFPFQGYAAVSITFSTLSIIVSYIFAYRLWKDINLIKKEEPSFKWFKTALLFLVFSSIGIFIMVYFMITKNMNPNLHLAAVYLFLHFQYNGWFVFSCLGLLQNKLKDRVDQKKISLFFWINALACIPAYFLSAPWLPVPKIIFILVVASAVLQFLSWIWVAFKSKERALLDRMPRLAKWLLSLSALSYTLKVILQLGSTIPALSNIAFGFRPVVVAYLHLVFLCVISFFIIGYVLGWIFTRISTLAKIGAILFISGVILSETALMVQGLFAIGYHIIPYINEVIFGITVFIFLGVVMLVIGLLQKDKRDHSSKPNSSRAAAFIML